MVCLQRNTNRIILLFTIAFAIAIPAKSQSHLAFSGAREDYQFTGGFAVGDFNGDGFPDIATSNSVNQIVILLNDGTGHFAQSASIPGNPANYLVAGDFNNDGFVDIAFTTFSTLNILLGNGDGTFRNLFTLSNVSVGDLRVADLNGDGKLDLVIDAEYVSYCLGYGDGTLQAPIQIPGISSPIAIADVNGDHKPDIVASLQGSVQVELNNGNGTFTPGFRIPVGSGYLQAMAAGDIDGNGTADLVVAASDPFRLIVLKGDGAGNFTVFTTVPLSINANNVALLDVNGDGKLDLLYDRVSTNNPPATNLVLELGNGDGTFGTATNIATAGADDRILLSDTRKSGELDLLTGGAYDEISILLNKGNGTFTEGSFFKLSGVLQSSVDGDFNHDGIRDMAVSVRLSVGDAVNPQSNSQFAGAYVLLGTGNPKSPFTVGQRLYIPPDVLKVATADFNNDGNPDLAFVTGQDLVIYLGAGDGTFSFGSQYACSCSTLTTGDFNGDGNVDIATTGVYLFFGNGNGTFGTPIVPFIGGSSFLAAGDFNADGKLDLIGLQGSYLITALGHGNGTFSLEQSQVSSSTFAGAVADLNGDGVPDLALLNGYDVYIYLNNGKGLFTQSGFLNSPSTSSANTIVAADFNNDGKMDLAVPGLDMLVYVGLGDGTFQLPVSFGAANYPNVILADDFYDFGTGHLPDLIGIGQNGAISTLFNETH